MMSIADHPGTYNKLSTLELSYSNFDSDETVYKLADILKSAFHFKKCNIRSQVGNRKVKVEIQYAND